MANRQLARNLEAERLQVIEERKIAFQRFALASEDKRKMIHSEYIQPLNQRLNLLNRWLGV